MNSKFALRFFKPKNALILSVAIFLTLSITQIPVVLVKAQSYTDISVQTAYDMINNNTLYPALLVLDVREQWEYNENHLYNATLIPLGDIDSRINELAPYNNTEIIVYCMSGSRSAIASQNLADDHNFTKIYNMLGGINAWIGTGYPVENETTQSFTYTDITVQEAYSMINNFTFYPDLIVLDVRTQEEYDSSHICNATLIPRGELESRINELQLFNDTEIIVYCASGYRSQQASEILVSYNFTKVYNMLGGITAWIDQGYEVCTNGQTQPIISSSFIVFLVLFLLSSVILITFYKKKISKSRNYLFIKKKINS